jgi:glycosyltransferase involved in cell wall biosynthesis
VTSVSLPPGLRGARAAIVHDALVARGGAERVVLAFADLFPDAPIYTSVYRPDTTFPEYHGRDVRTSFLQRVGQRTAFYRAALPLFPLAFEALDLSGFDLVLSSSAHWAKGVITDPTAFHVCYCNTPSRIAWRLNDYVRRERLGHLGRAAMHAYGHLFRIWDVASAPRVDLFVAGSANSADRIRKYYGRDAVVLRSPVEVERFDVGEGEGEFFLVVARLVPYKRVDLAVQTFSRLGWPLVVVGTGPSEGALKRAAGPTVRFAGAVSEAELADYYARCRALVVCCEEDYGLTPLEANAAGRPVVAFGRGGALETVVPGKTGILFDRQTPESLAEALRRVEPGRFDAAFLRRHAERFDTKVFGRRLLEIIEPAFVAHRGRRGNESSRD